jgi:hypothetical protein
MWNEHKRLTVRAAKHHPWITGNKPNDPAVPEQPYVHEPIEFVNLDFEHDKKSRNTFYRRSFKPTQTENA